jgi:hypothetical protein
MDAEVTTVVIPTATGSEAILAAVTALLAILAVVTALSCIADAPTLSAAGEPIIDVVNPATITSIDEPRGGAVEKVIVVPDTEYVLLN